MRGLIDDPERSARRSLDVLVVDDIAEMREIVVRLLRALGFERISVARNGEEAGMQIESQDFDLVLCDWNMPGVTGHDLLVKLRRRPAGAQTPFIMITGEATAERITSAIADGVSDYLLKPFTMASFEKKIVEALAKRAQMDGSGGDHAVVA